MAEDYYAGDEEAASGESGRKPDSKSGDMDSCLVPRSMFQGKSLKPGDEFVFKVVHQYGDEIEVAYSKGEEKKPEMEKEPMQEKGSAMAAFDDSFKGQETMMEG